MRHPCEPSEYQFHYDRCYLRNSNGRQGESDQSANTASGSPPGQVPSVRYPVPNRDLDILFEVKKSRKPGECLANIQYDKLTGPYFKSSDLLYLDGFLRHEIKHTTW